MTTKVFVKLNVILTLFGIGISAHAVPLDVVLTNTVQIRTASNNPYFTSEGQKDLVGVNLYYSYGAGAAVDQPVGTVNGVGFDNIDMWNGATTNAPAGAYALSANGIGSYISVTSTSTYNAVRSQASVIDGPDAANLKAVDNEFYWLQTGNGRSPLTLTFTGLGVSEGDTLYVQLIGGQHASYFGHLSVTVNGSAIGNWEFPGVQNQAELFAFETTAGSGGSLTLKLASVEASQALGLSGVIISAAQGAQAAPFVAVPLINTAQIRTASNDPYFTSPGQVDLVAVNLYYSSGAGAAVDQPVGTVNGVGFDNIDMWNGATTNAPAPGPYALSANGIGSYISVTSTSTYNAVRSQASVIDGPDAANLKAVDDEFFWLQKQSGRSPFTLTFTGLGVSEGDTLYVQLIGGQHASYFGHLSVTVNGSAIGNWPFFGLRNQAELFAFETTAGAGGSLTLTLASVEASQALGLSGVIISSAQRTPGAPIAVPLINTAQIRTASNDPYFTSPGQRDLAGVNLYYSGGSVNYQAAVDRPTGTVNGVGFDNIDMWNGANNIAPAPGPYALSANRIGPSLLVTSAATYNESRKQASVIAGPDAANLKAVDDEFYFFQSTAGRSPFTLTFTGLGVSAGDALYVQLIGARHLVASSTGKIGVTANGSAVGNWPIFGVLNQAELFAFNTTAGAGGSLTLTLTWVSGANIGISGVIISETAPFRGTVFTFY